MSYVWKDGWTLGTYSIGMNNTDFYKNTPSLADTDVKSLGSSGGYITVGGTF